MKIQIDRFGGIIPGTDPVNLPQNGAQTALNVDLSEGTIKPWSVTNDFRSLNDGTVMNSEVSAGEFSQPAKPASAPTIAYGNLIADYTALFTSIKAKIWKYDRTDGTGDGSEQRTLIINGATRTVTGFVLHCEYPSEEIGADGDTTDDAIAFTMLKGDRYEIVGPLYQVNIASVEATDTTTYTFPTAFQSGGPILPAFTIPIYSDAGNKHTSVRQVGNLQLVDVSGPQSAGIYEYPGDSGTTTLIIGGNVDLHFECNWIRNTPVGFYYLSQTVTAGVDGPQSDISEEAIIEPGKYAIVTYTGDRLYRSTNSASGFGLIDTTGSPFIDDLTDGLIEDLPPNGTITSLTTVGSIVHPAGYAVYYKDATLYPSSEWIDAPRYWAVPQEYAYTFDSTIQCIGLAGGTILVFTQTSVYRVHGQHPGRLTIYKISDLPILNKLSLWRDEVTVGWCNVEGLTQYNGSTGQLLTGPYMRADRWNAYTPANMVAKVNDKAVCLFDGSSNLRFDFRGDRSAAISTFTVTDGSVAATWRSRRFRLPKPMSWYACRINTSTATSSVSLTIFGDGVTLISQSVATNEDILLPRTVKALEWEFQVATLGEVREILFATNRREL